MGSAPTRWKKEVGRKRWREKKRSAQYKNRTNRHGQTMKRLKERKRIRIAWGSNKTGLGYTVSSNNLMIIKV